MNITFTGLALIASLSNTVSPQVPSTNITPSKPELFSKSELVQIIDDKQNDNITFDQMIVSFTSISIDNTELVAKRNKASNSDSISNKVDKANSDE
jgi:hypothetical protein